VVGALDAQERDGRIPDKGLIERLLSPVADVRDGEAASALFMTATMFFALGGYYLLKTAREMLILSEGGAEVKSYSSAGQAVLLLALVPAYGAFASRVNRTQLVRWVTLFFGSNLIGFLVAIGAGWRVGIPFFLWVGIFNVMVIAQFWAFAADLYTEDQGKRLFPLIGVGSSLGAWLGSVRAGQLMESVGVSRLIVGGGVCLIVCVVLVALAERATRRRLPRAVAADDRLASGTSGFRMIATDRYLMLIAALVVLLNVVASSGDYLFGRYVVDLSNALPGTGVEGDAARQQFIGEVYSSYFSAINLIGLLLQLFVVSRIFRFVGVGGSLLIHPVVTLVSYLFMAAAPSFGAIRALKIADNAMSYSLSNTTRHALWLPTTREAKYKAKQAVDSFCMRAGDVLQAGVVYAGELTALTVGAFAALNIVFAGAWIAVAIGLRNRLQARSQAAGGAEL
jgi:AAA family ATP:ADP antiporter